MTLSLDIRQATFSDIPDMHRIRVAVRENALIDLSRVTFSDYEQMIASRGCGWVCEIDGVMRGFSFADLSEKSIWALFIMPEFEGLGIGKLLHDHAVQWLFSHQVEAIWLTTAPQTRAEKFYLFQGWYLIGDEPNGDRRLQLDRNNYKIEAKVSPTDS